MPVDVRIIAASHQNLAELVKDGTFREDLFYRIRVIHLNLPDLKNRREDVPLLIDHQVKNYPKNEINSNISGCFGE